MSLALLLAVVGIRPVPSTVADEPERALVFGAFAQPQAGQSLQQAVTQLDTQIDRTLPIVRVFETWDETFPDSYHQWLRDTGRTLILSVKPIRSNGSRVSWTSISAALPGSQIDGEIRSWARRVRDFGSPIYVTFNHEPESSSSSVGTAAQFVAAWRTWVRVFREEGVTNAHHMWITTDYAHWVSPSDRRFAPNWYPGDDWVDSMGIDAYNWFTCRPNQDNVWKTLAQIIEPFRRFGASHPTKELWLTEWASCEDPGTPNRKAQWIDEARVLFAAPLYAQFAGILYFHSKAINASFVDCNWRVDTSASALASFAAMANDEFWSARPFASPPPTTTTTTTPSTTTPPGPGIAIVGQVAASANTTLHRVVVPAEVRPGDALVLAFSANTNATVTGPAGVTGWTSLGTRANSSMSSRLWTKVAAAGDAGRTVTITIATTSKGNVSLVAYRGTSPVSPVAVAVGALETVARSSHTTPSATVVDGRSWVISYWAHEDATTTALIPPADLVTRTTGSQTGSGRITVLFADTGGPAGTGTWPGHVARAAAATVNATMWTVVLAAG